MTDEELRQQYGIQLASRPVDSGDGKEAKWADIDDDEDDWAPETIEWNDGTKINLAQVDNSAPAAEMSSAAEKAKDVKPPQPLESKHSTPKVTSIGPKATVLKLGGSTQPKPAVAEPPSTAAKPITDKPTLVVKPTPAAPPKNPWAQLPPVDKVSPVAPPVQYQQPRLGQRDPRNFESMPPPPLPPAKEIAADDFSRLPRDSTSNIPRELFNSQSGQYEPVADSRRMPKKDQGFRTPSVLQRPSQSDIYSPAEPSPAFQTARSQQDPTQWRRRRASSNVSGENDIFARRMSTSKTPYDNIQRRDSQLEQPITPGISSAQLDQRDTSPAISHTQSVSSQSPVVTVAQPAPLDQNALPQGPQTPGTPMTPGAPVSEEVKMQKTLMREKAQAAHKRRLEEEQRQEAEKKERLRLKMEKMGLTDDNMRKKEPEKETADPLKVILKDDIASPSAIPAEPVKAISPPKPPVPTVNGEPQQYGLMKVHAPQVVAPSSPGLEKKSLSPTELHRDDKQEVRLPPIREPASIVAPPNTEQVQKQPSPVMSRPQLEREKTAEYPPQRLTPAPPMVNGYQAWPQHSMATHSTPGGNVWAPPANHKGLGNGDFQRKPIVNSTQQSYPPPPQHLVSPQPQPQPIGTPRQQIHNKSEPPIVSLPRHVDIPPQSISFGSDPNTLPSSNLRTHLSNLPSSLDQEKRQHHPIPLHTMPQREAPKGGMAVWSDFSKNAAAYDAKARNKIAQDHVAYLDEQQKAGKSTSAGPVLNETWTQVTRGESAGVRQQLGSVKTQREFVNQDTTASIPVRSRFQDIFDQNARAYPNQAAVSLPAPAPSPPAEVELHPVFGVTQRPVVKLPGSKATNLDDVEEAQRPIVRLPPPKALNVIGAPPPPEPRLSLSPLRAQPFIANPTWQDRINGLFDRKTIGERKPVDAADFSVSKPAVDLFSISATPVTLPPPGSQSILASQMLLRTIEEEDALFEERDFGSVPTVRVPAMAPPKAWNPAEPHIDVKMAKQMALSDMGISSGFDFIPGFDALTRQGDIPVVIKFAGMTTAKTKMLPRTGNFKPSRKPYTNMRGKPAHYGHRSREPSSTNAPSQTRSNTGRQTGQQTGGHRKTSGNANQTWARRLSAMAQ